MRLDREDREHIENGELILNNFQKNVDNLKEKCYNESVNSFKEENIEEDIEKHDTLNPKLFDEDNHLKPEVRDKMLEIVDDFVDGLKEDGVDINVKDIILVGSSASYNYTKDSDVDLHIIADHKKSKANYELLPLLYSAYRSVYNKNYDISFYGIPVELYVEMDDDDENVLQESKTNTKSNGIYSVQDDKWIKEPVQQDIPDIDREAFDEVFKEYEDRYFEIIEDASIEGIEDFIDDLYDLRKEGLAEDGEYSIKNLVFKEARNLGYLDNLKELKNKLKSKQLSLEQLGENKMKVRLKDIKERYNDYLINEFDEEYEDNGSPILGLLYTTVNDDEIEIQVSYDLEHQQMILEMTDEDGKTLTYKEKESLEDFYEELDSATFDGYYSWAHGIVETKFKREDIEF